MKTDTAGDTSRKARRINHLMWCSNSNDSYTTGHLRAAPHTLHKPSFQSDGSARVRKQASS